jgi:hypothetical protein
MWFRTISALWLAGIAFVAVDAARNVRLHGKFPASTETMDVDMQGTVAEALQKLAGKQGWALAASAPTLDQKISLKTAKRPVMETLALVLEAGDLQARLTGTTLVVKPYRKNAELDEEEETDEDEDANAAPPPDSPDAPDLPDAPDPPDAPDAPERTAYGQDLIIEKGESVDDVVVQGGDLIVRGQVRGDAAAMGGDIIVESGGVIQGDAAAMGGDVVLKKGGAIKGSISKVGGGYGNVFKNLAKRAAPPHARSYDRDDEEDSSSTGFLFFLTLFASIASFVISVILIAFVPERIERITSMLQDKPMQSAAGGIATLVGFFPFCVLLGVSIIGIALIPLACVVLVMLYVAGYTAICVLLGQKLPFFQGRKTMLGAMGLGLATLTLLALIPWFGSVCVFIITTVGAGAVVISRAGTPPKIVEAT